MRLRGVRSLVLAAGLLACGALQAMPPMLVPRVAAPAVEPPPPAAEEPAQEAAPEPAPAQEQAQEAVPEPAPEQVQEAVPEPAPEQAPAPSLDLRLHEAPATQFVAPASEAVPSDTSAAPAAPANDAEPAAEAVAAPTEAPIPKKVAYERCGVVYEAARGSIATKVIPSMHVADLADDASFEMPVDVPANVKAVQCGRDSIVPLPNDYKVLAAGFPLSIVARDGRVAVLEATDGSKLSIDEDTRARALIEEAQPAFDIAPRAGTR